jgi:hypothetical protein
MKVLLDECLPKALISELPEHEVWTVPQKGWASKRNGELLSLMATHFDVFVTVDANLEYQQRLSSLAVGLVVLHVYSNRIENVRPVVPKLNNSLARGIVPGEIVHIEAD